MRGGEREELRDRQQQRNCQTHLGASLGARRGEVKGASRAARGCDSDGLPGAELIVFKVGPGLRCGPTTALPAASPPSCHFACVSGFDHRPCKTTRLPLTVINIHRLHPASDCATKGIPRGALMFPNVEEGSVPTLESGSNAKGRVT